MADHLLQSSEARLYTFSQETKDHLRKFRLGTSRSNEPQAVICTYAIPWVVHLPSYNLAHQTVCAAPLAGF